MDIGVVSKSCFLSIFFITHIGNAAVEKNTVVHRAGDYRENYNKDYQTQSRSVDYRNQHKKSFDLLHHFNQPPLGLPKVLVGENNPINRDKINLGKKLFFDRRLSLNNTISCAICHIPEQGFSNNELAESVGIEGRNVRRNAPTIYNVAYMQNLFHDAREDSLEWQVWTPLLAKNEMGNPSFSNVVNKIKGLKDYMNLFAKAFAGEGVSVANIGKALASYERALLSGNSNFDKWYYNKEKNMMSAEAQQGFNLFIGKANCVACHKINEKYALFMDHKLHNTGMGYLKSMAKQTDYTKVQISPSVYVNVDNAIINQVSRKINNDLGLYEISENPKDRWKYKTPSLRNIALTSPYMHNGSLPTLQKVVEFYNQGGVKNAQLSSLIRPLNLSQDEQNAIVAFLKNLTGSHIDDLVADAFATPIGEIQ